jgi:hypothetical protein
MCFLRGTNWVFISQMTAFFKLLPLKPQVLHGINRLGYVMKTQCVSCEVGTGFFVSQETAFFIVTAVKTSNLTNPVEDSPSRFQEFLSKFHKCY